MRGWVLPASVAAILALGAPPHAQERVPSLEAEEAWVFMPVVSPLLGERTMVRFSSSDSARRLVDKIMSAIGLPARFEVYAGPVGNAAARIEEGGVRVIYYSESWVQRMIAKDEWKAIALLGHEIGHHLSNHTLQRLDDRPLQELEADKFSGFVVGSLCGSIDDAQRLYAGLPLRSTATHPGRADRLEAVAVGWRDGRAKCGSAPGATRTASLETPSPSPAPARRAPLGEADFVFFGAGGLNGAVVEAAWRDDAPPPFEGADLAAFAALYCSLTWGDCGDGDRSDAMPAGHDYETIGIRVCDGAGNQYQLTHSGKLEARFRRFSRLAAAEKEQVLAQTAAFREISRFDPPTRQLDPFRKGGSQQRSPARRAFKRQLEEKCEGG